jgi:lipid A 3-O-deacylase
MKITRHIESSKHLLRFSLKIMAGFVFLALIAILVTAWLASDPIFKMLNGFSRKAWKKMTRRNFRGRFFTGRIRLGATVAVISTAITARLSSAQAQTQASSANAVPDATRGLTISNTNIWENGVGSGFKSGIQSISLSLGAGYGVQILGSRQSHDLALAGISYGYMLGSVEGEGHWYRGNWELRGELISGGQFSPTSDWLVGITPHLRYNFATGTHWIPYVDLGAGVSATSIGPPDLSHYFEFNLQAATGVRWFIRDNVALGIEARYLHMSCADINTPNLGLNNVNGMLSISWFF